METESVALILSSVISIISVVSAAATAISQQYNQRKTKIMEMYFEAQLKAYTEFYTFVVNIDNPNNTDVDKVVATAKAAEMLSPQKLSIIIDNFCFTYLEYADELTKNKHVSEKTKNDFRDIRNIVEEAMREELMRYDTSKRKYIKRIDKEFQNIQQKQ